MEMNFNPHCAYAEVGKDEGVTIYWGKEFEDDNIIRWIGRVTKNRKEITWIFRTWDKNQK